jgi:hypothetical protein
MGIIEQKITKAMIQAKPHPGNKPNTFDVD